MTFYGCETSGELISETIELLHDSESWHLVNWSLGEPIDEASMLQMEISESKAIEGSKLILRVKEYFDRWNSADQTRQDIWKSMAPYINDFIVFENPDVNWLIKNGFIRLPTSTKKVILMASSLFHNKYHKCSVSKLKMGFHPLAGYLAWCQFDLYHFSGATLTRRALIHWTCERVSENMSDNSSDSPENEYCFQASAITVGKEVSYNFNLHLITNANLLE